MTATLPTRTNPYVGPRAFQQGETLYGRDLEVMQLLHLLIAERIVLFHSPSGAGKTSLIQAALIPKLEEEGFHVLPPMRVSLVPPPDERIGSPSNRYLFSLLLSLEEALPPEQRTPLAELSALTLGEYLDRRQDGDGAVGTVLILDQFEEILTLDPTDRELKLGFFAQVGAALRDRRRWALFVMREEFIAALEDAYLRPIPTRLRTRYRLGLLAPKQARQAIQEPAKAAGVAFTDPAADKLVRDLSTVRVLQPDGSTEKRLGPYVEPVQLQVVCRRLWDLLPEGASQIVEEDIGRLADVDLALSGYYDQQVKAALSGYYADQVQAAAGPLSRLGAYLKKTFAAALGFGLTERTIRNWFDRKLITEQGIRDQVLEGPKESEGLDNRAIRPLVGAHLVRAERRRGATWLELAHDRLIEPVQASNAAWRRARLTRRIAVGIALISILAIALALSGWLVGNNKAADERAKADAARAEADAALATVACLKTKLSIYEGTNAMIRAPADGASFDEGELITFTGSAPDAEDVELTDSLLWVSSLDGPIGNSASFSRSDLSPGTHTITATATLVDCDLPVSDTLIITVRPPNTPPEVTISAPADGESFDGGDPITFTGSATDDEDRDETARLEWVSSLDGSIGCSASFSRSDLSPGTHTITATATDSGGLTGTDEITITVKSANRPPTATISHPADGATFIEGESIDFSGTATDAEDGDVTASLEWVSSIDGLIDSGGSFSTSDLPAGTHTISATATDGGGLTGTDEITLTVNPANTPPTVTISPPADSATFVAGETIDFSGKATDAQDGDVTASLEWVSSIDGPIDSGESFSTSDLSVGTHTITATATDSGGLTGADEITITVNPANTPPTATISAPANGATFSAGEAISFSGSATDMDDGDVTASLEWVSSIDGSIDSGGSFSTSGLSAGTHTISATARDNGGRTGTDEIAITICAGVQAPFARLWRRYRNELGCPLGAPVAIQDAEQAFENGRMFWWKYNKDAWIYVLYERGEKDGEYQEFRNGRLEGPQPDCPYPCEASPPEGFFQPQSGFRVAWCQLCAEDALIGWALEGERGFGPGSAGPWVQYFDRGLIFRQGEGNTQRQIYILFAKDGTFKRVPY